VESPSDISQVEVLQEGAEGVVKPLPAWLKAAAQHLGGESLKKTTVHVYWYAEVSFSWLSKEQGEELPVNCIDLFMHSIVFGRLKRMARLDSGTRPQSLVMTKALESTPSSIR
jgi:hypothetical protein